MQVFGVAYLGPFGHFLHILLDKLFKGKKDTKTVAKKVLSTSLCSWFVIARMVPAKILILEIKTILFQTNLETKKHRYRYGTLTRHETGNVNV